jgi:hypothetical protein
MQADLARSGLLPQDMEIEPIVEAFSQAVTGYRIPYYRTDGTPHPFMHRIRHLNVAPGQPRYGQPSGEEITKGGGTAADAVYPYFNPHIIGGMTWDGVAKLPGKRVLIVEGEKKAVAVGKFLKRFAVGIGGCWNAIVRDDREVFHLHPALRALLRPGDTVEVVFDGDMLTNPLVNRAAGSLRRALMRCGVAPLFVMLPQGAHGEKVGVDDWLMQVMRDAPGTENLCYDALPRISGMEGDGLTEDHRSLWDYLGLICNDSGPLSIEENVRLLLAKHERYLGRVWFDVMDQRIWHALNSEQQQFTDAQAFHEVAWMQRMVGFLKLRRGPVLEAFMSIPADPTRQRNPLADSIRSVEWDGEDRLETMFIKAFGAVDGAYTRSVGRCWLISAVARVFEPGCQVDTMLILEGKQGIGKSTALKILGDRWYIEAKQAIGEKDFVMVAHHGWLVDMIELGAFKYADFSHIKGEITTRIDSIRPPYGRSVEDTARRFIFVGTTNGSGYLRDETGNRRFWPIACHGAVRLKWLRDNRDQLLAEAYYRYKQGESWWDVDFDAQARVTSARMEFDPWEEQIAGILSDPTAYHRIDSVELGPAWFITSGEILYAMGLELAHQNPAVFRRLSRAVLAAGGPAGWVSHHYASNLKPIQLKNGVVTRSARGYALPIPQIGTGPEGGEEPTNVVAWPITTPALPAPEPSVDSDSGAATGTDNGPKF